jgi:hypothetical protein
MPYLELAGRIGRSPAPELSCGSFLKSKPRIVVFAGCLLICLAAAILALWYYEYSCKLQKIPLQSQQEHEEFLGKRDCTARCNHAANVFFDGHGPFRLSKCVVDPERVKREPRRGWWMFWQRQIATDLRPADLNLTDPGSYVCKETCAFSIGANKDDEDASFVEFVKGKLKVHMPGSGDPDVKASQSVKANFVRSGDAEAPSCHFQEWAVAPGTHECAALICEGGHSDIDGSGPYHLRRCYVNPIHRKRLKHANGTDVAPGDFDLLHQKGIVNDTADFTCVETCYVSVDGKDRRAEFVRSGQAQKAQRPTCRFFSWSDAPSAGSTDEELAAASISRAVQS